MTTHPNQSIVACGKTVDIGTPVVTLDEISIVNLTPPAGVVQVTEDTALSSQIVATDVDGDALTFTLNTDAANGTVTVNPAGSFTYTPNAEFNGADSFTVDVTDGVGGVTSQTISLNVAPGNDAPVAVTDALITDAAT
ncbi:MAG: cadherin-like domain-containing protein, partial [Nitrospinae bacterium]|nr:cadherin-like domain-containing protein [Nitrospinota bacterium]